jgi:outer membrane immunogenic protein
VALAIAVTGMSSPALAAWDGWYLGISGGWGGGHGSQSGGILQLPSACSSGSHPSTITIGSSTTIICISNIADGSYNLSGGLVGGTVGYNWENGRYVFGLEGDGSWADIRGSGTCGFPPGGGPSHACGGSIDALGTVRARLGYDLGPVIPTFTSILAYATGGLAVGDIHAWDSLFGTSGDKTVAGWTVGGGFEAMLNANWSVKLEYLHVDFGNPAVFTAIPPNPEHVSTTADIVRVGLNYHFNWQPPPAPPPVITKSRPISK